MRPRQRFGQGSSLGARCSPARHGQGRREARRAAWPSSPPTWHCVELKELVPSCVLQARIRTAARDVEVVVQSVYLPPDAREETVTAYQAALDQHGDDGPFYAAGDFNLQLLRPRDAEEAALAGRLHDSWRRRGGGDGGATARTHAEGPPQEGQARESYGTGGIHH